ncbi:hypothetical protein LJK88_34560 [Paenibacillus sp. P26]|nr:hypothetical protein LJK88_34560 [Paenibacillus sp. P26]
MDRYPFAYDHSRPFIEQVSAWIADVFYDVLPESGFEVRDEQIYMAFQLERAFAEKQTIFAEAGVGTGKTLVYLLYAVCYARYHRKPVIIACADESLIEQLVKSEGDIAKLAEHLHMKIDARLGKSLDQYACLVKLDEARLGHEEPGLYQEIYEGLPEFVRNPGTLQAFHAYGDRKHYPHLTDAQWSKIGWDTFQDCFVCDKRHRRGPDAVPGTLPAGGGSYHLLARFLYGASVDIRRQETGGTAAALPEHCAVVFDEGHLLEAAAQKALTYKLKHIVFEEVITRLLKGEVRESFAVLIDEAILQSESLFELLERQAIAIPGSDRKQILLTGTLLEEIRRFREILASIEEELVFESELFTLNQYQAAHR